MKKRTPRLVVANWKLNPPSLGEGKKLFLGIRKKARAVRGVTTVVCPPFVFISSLRSLFTSRSIALGAQDVSSETEGAFTGEVSARMLKSAGATYVIIGHSERRARGEDNKEINKKIHTALKAGFRVILCIGESVRDEHGEYLSFLKREIEEGLAHVPQKSFSQLIIAYEPIWAIGKGADYAITPHELHEMVIFVRKTMKEIFKKSDVVDVPILYGGSVGPENADELLRDGNVDGFLVGSQSLSASHFGEILLSAAKKS